MTEGNNIPAGLAIARYMAAVSDENAVIDASATAGYPVSRIRSDGSLENLTETCAGRPGPLVWVYPEGGDTDFIGRCIGSGMPLSCVMSSAYMEQLILLRGCIFICPEEIYDNVERLSGNNGIICYGKDDNDPAEMLEALRKTGYSLSFGKSTPLLFWLPRDNGFISGTASDNACDIALDFPAGTPVFTGLNSSVCHISGRITLECRVFVCQKQGKASVSETGGCLRVSGLEDAFIKYYPPEKLINTDILGWTRFEDELGFICFSASGISGSVDLPTA